MIKTTYALDKNIIIKSHLEKIKNYKVITHYFKSYICRFATMALIVNFLSGLYNVGISQGILIISVIVCSIIFSLVAKNEYINHIIDSCQDGHFEVCANEDGVVCELIHSKYEFKWTDYEWYEELEEYIKFKNINGEISFVPKNADTLEIIELVKRKIHRRVI